MDAEIVLGVALIIAVLSVMTALVAWSRWSINRIAEKRLESVRDIVRELRNGG